MACLGPGGGGSRFLRFNGLCVGFCVGWGFADDCSCEAAIARGARGDRVWAGEVGAAVACEFCRGKAAAGQPRRVGPALSSAAAGAAREPQPKLENVD